MTNPDDKHPEYNEYSDVWRKCRDAAGGQRLIKKGGELYLKRLQNQPNDAYLAYLDRAVFFGATGRTVEAMTGLVFQKQMDFEAPNTVKAWAEDITLSGENLIEFAQTAIAENITVGRSGILVEQPQAAGENLTLAQKEALAVRPYLVLYQTESILNWEYARVGNIMRLVNVWLAEKYKNEKDEQADQVRQLTLSAGAYQQIIWRKGDGAKWIAFDTITPKKNGATIPEIPFFPIAPQKPKLDPVAPPIEPLADINIAHFKNSADLENGAHIAGLPTPWVSGADDTDGEGKAVTIYLGSSTILMLPKDAQAGFLQCGSEGFATIEKLMDRKEQQMAALGARMLSPEKKEAEAAETHEIKRGGENSVLATMAGVVERQITKALQFAADWEGITGEIYVELNKDYVPFNLTGQDLTSWTAALQAGAISKETYFNILKWGGYYADETTFEEEQDRIAEDGPPLGALTDDKPPGPANGND